MTNILRKFLAVFFDGSGVNAFSVPSIIEASPLRIVCSGIVEYPEDDPVFGTYCVQHALVIDGCASIEEAIGVIHDRIARNDLGSDADGALSFTLRLFTVLDDEQRLALVGEVRGGSIRWCPPTLSDEEASHVAAQVARLRAEASFEAGWDNSGTAENLRFQADVLAGRLVDPFWRDAARTALTPKT
ncbi:hypothetical protein [Ochrobactrum sp. BTU2]|uniref:hypothetical protein n=1 Tax=Ochrobactrum sp. BTU2 TaxID=2856166 RepID=UPI00211A5392|nr:hypothetical protein [Ochrobactrum sp. BTU2]MCQ9148094.1 hypothetical protein [Ochrobactrum sp. BTU2]